MFLSRFLWYLYSDKFEEDGYDLNLFKACSSTRLTLSHCESHHGFFATVGCPQLRMRIQFADV